MAKSWFFMSGSVRNRPSRSDRNSVTGKVSGRIGRGLYGLGLGDHRMIDTLLNLLFRCRHRRLTRPVTPVYKTGMPHGETYVACLDCGKQFAYDVKEMRIGKPIVVSPDLSSVLPEEAPKASRRKLRYAFWASVPIGMAIGAGLRHSGARGDKASRRAKKSANGGPGESR